ncbi:MAG: single-stranded DNA-binding protein [Eubacterium sp.]
MINNVTLMGRLTANPELRTTTNGTSVTSFTLAVDRDYVAKGEERQADFINIVAWRNTADFITRNFTKGKMIAVTGSIQTRSYDDKNGKKRTAVEVVAEKVSFCGDKQQSNSQITTSEDYTVIPVDDDDLPF